MTTDAIRRGRACAPATALVLLVSLLLVAAPRATAEEEKPEGLPKLPWKPGMVNVSFTEQVGDVIVRQYEPSEIPNHKM